ncbi:MAG: hypothetical protein IMZ67_09685, partial [Acidobacteria bacterium]|nr:hypothetical protein [Acidobacteriota bacterium]
FRAVPGFIDAHVHMTGGGGEGGYATRTPELLLSDAIRGGALGPPLDAADLR